MCLLAAFSRFADELQQRCTAPFALCAGHITHNASVDKKAAVDGRISLTVSSGSLSFRLFELRRCRCGLLPIVPGLYRPCLDWLSILRQFVEDHRCPLQAVVECFDPHNNVITKHVYDLAPTDLNEGRTDIVRGAEALMVCM